MVATAVILQVTLPPRFKGSAESALEFIKALSEHGETPINSLHFISQYLKNTTRHRERGEYHLPMTYTEAKKIQLALEMRLAVAGVALRAFPRLPNGLTPDSTKLLPGYRAARIESDTAFAALRTRLSCVRTSPKPSHPARRVTRPRHRERAPTSLHQPQTGE
jgi:hypothetical protein